MQLGIKAKFIGILLIASALPLTIGIIAVWVLGARDFQRQRGLLFQTAASHLAAGLSEAVTFGFIEAKAAEFFTPGQSEIVAVANPQIGRASCRERVSYSV